MVQLYRTTTHILLPSAAMAAVVDLAVDCRSVLGESPIWCGRTKRLYWVDINGKTISAYEPAAQQMPCLPVALTELVGTIVPRAGGNLLACLEENVVSINPDTRVVGLPVASVPKEHRARPERNDSHGLAHSDARHAHELGAALDMPRLLFSPRCGAPGGPGMRFNDGKCDLQGRLWVGTMHSSCVPSARRERVVRSRRCALLARCC